MSLHVLLIDIIVQKFWLIHKLPDVAIIDISINTTNCS